MPCLPFLLQQPSKWTTEHLRDLRLVDCPDTAIDVMVGAEHVPKDGDGEFETLAAEFVEPTKQELESIALHRFKYRRNIFNFVFVRLNNALRSKENSEVSKEIILVLFHVLLSNVEAAKDLDITWRRKIPFETRSSGIQGPGFRGALKCEGALIKSSSPALPLSTISVAKNGNQNLTQEISQILLQGVLAYNAYPSHAAFVIRMDRTALHVTKAIVHRDYINDLAQGRSPGKDLQLFHSATYDLCECDQRKEALRLIIGLFRLLNA